MKEEKLKIENHIMKKIVIFIILIMVIMGLHTISRAYSITTSVDVPKVFDRGSMLPARNIAGVSGMFPQYYLSGATRTINLDDSRLNWLTNKWQANMNGKVVYCAAYGSYVRYGKYDDEKHYLVPDNTTIQGYNIPIIGNTIEQQAESIKNSWMKEYQRILENEKYFSDPTTAKGESDKDKSTLEEGFSVEAIYSVPEKKGVGYVIAIIDQGGSYPNEEQAISAAENGTKYIMQNTLEIIGKEIWPSKYSSSIDNKNYTQSSITGTQGPEVVVLEQSDKASDHYIENGGETFTNNQKAFIFSAMENAYGKKEDYAKEYSLNDIQGAYWKILEQEGGPTPTTHITEKAIELYERSKEYAAFAGNFSATIDSSKAQVISDTENKQYIIGPYSIDYPYFEDISYMKSLSINESENLLYDEKHDGIELILENGKGSGTKVIGSNGMEKEYPRPNQKFFIKFSAEKAGMPTNVTFNAKFEYINKTYANVETTLTANANIYKYYGYSLLDGEYPMETGKIQIRVRYTVGRTETKKVGTGEYYTDESGRVHEYMKEITICRNDHFDDIVGDYPVYQPYIKMGEEKVSSGKAQKLIVIGDALREYNIVNLGTSIDIPDNPPDNPPGIPVDLSIELGGYVWEDINGGKESISNGMHDNTEKRIPNVIVTLYRQDGIQIATTKTDSNGEYRFTGLNAMYKYYVKFTYNGQYYQSTTFADSNTWMQNDWKINSNAKDIRNERLSYNAKFESIGSSPENYKGSEGYNETFSKQELLGYTLQTDGTYKKTREAVIDEFGNLILNNSSDIRTQKMIQYVKDCMLDSYTNADNSKGLYPVPDIFVIDTFQYPCLYTPNAVPLYPNSYYINLGLNPREEADLAIKKDIEKVTLEINGQTHTYTYDTLENKENAEVEWDISVRLSDAYYNASYSRELYKSDYIYKSSMYGDNSKLQELGKSKEDELKVYVTYKIMIQNQAMSIRAKVDEIVDYYDKDYEYIDERSYIEIKRGENKGIYSTKASVNTRYSDNTRTTLDGYDNLYITGLDDKYLTAGQRAYIYLTFVVKKDNIDGEDWVKLDEEIETANLIGVGKENIVEINGYSTQYEIGTKVPNVGDVGLTIAGIVDRDSNPGNLNPVDVPKDGNINYQNFEDDTDKAPNMKLRLYRDDNSTRVISGNVWEDERTDSIGVTTTGDGIRDNKDKTLINGVTVQLVELMNNGTEYVWREFGAPASIIGQEIGGENTIGKGQGTGTVSSEAPIINYKNLVNNYEFGNEHNGMYAFKSFIPGKYIVRFIYGDTIKTVTPSELNMGGLNEKSYNGQDYKSTTYQEGISQNKTYTWREKSTWNLGQETLGKILTEVTTFKQDASNNETTNATLNANEQKGYLYDITASDTKDNVSDAKDIESRRNEVINYSSNNITNYIAEVLASHKVDYNTMNNREQLLNDLITNTKMTAETGLMIIELEYDAIGTNGNKKDNSYKIQNVDLGLEERAKAQTAINKEVTNVKVILANGSILFDAKSTASNVLWKDHKPYDVGYKGNLMDENKFGSISNIRDKNANKFGLIQLTMDEELMHGATIEITYQVRVNNVGEVDYKDNLFYYTGNKSKDAKVVTTRVDQVIDYVANNLQFNSQNNKDWKVIEKDQIKSEGLVNAKLEEQLDKYNTIVITENLNKDLVPALYKEKEDKNAQDNVSIPLVLTQLITAENDSDDLTYRNLVEIVKTSNTIGRRMEYSVVGNQDPSKSPQELDSDIAEVVRILPPFGNSGIYFIILAVVILSTVIIIIGIIFIKKKVLKK